jgi:hypothetical protein
MSQLYSRSLRCDTPLDGERRPRGDDLLFNVRGQTRVRV